MKRPAEIDNLIEKLQKVLTMQDMRRYPYVTLVEFKVLCDYIAKLEKGF